MILLDVEADGLLENPLLPNDQQPFLVELSALKVSRNAPEVVQDRLHFLCAVPPGRVLTEKFTSITGIKADDLVGARSFASHFNKTVGFFLGEEELVAHNLSYDAGILELELARIGKTRCFPWPPRHLCTMELTQHITGKYLSLKDLYERLTGSPLAQTHRAEDDTAALHDVVMMLLRMETL